MITIRTTGGAIVGKGIDLGAIQRYSRRTGEKPEVRIVPDDTGGALCVLNWPSSYASTKVFFGSERLARDWFTRNGRIV